MRKKSLDSLDRKLPFLVVAVLLFCLGGAFSGLIDLPSPAPSAKAPVAGQGPYANLARPTAPVRLVVPSLSIKAPVLPIEVSPDAVLDPPRNPHDVGWWKRSAKPGATTGQTVLTGHTVHTGGGVMDRLSKLEDGSDLMVVTKKGTMLYRSTKVVIYTKAQLAKHSVDLFGQKRKQNRLVLITCTGWTGSDYTSNVVVFADPIGVAQPPAATTQDPSV